MDNSMCDDSSVWFSYAVYKWSSLIGHEGAAGVVKARSVYHL